MTKREQLGNFELMVMLALIRIGENAYGVPISEELEKRTGRDVAIGSVYAALERLEDKGFVTPELGEATPERGGRAKRYFRATGRGRREVWSHKLLIASAVLYGWSFWFYVSRFSFYLNLELFYAAVGRDWGETIPRLAVQLSELLLWGVLSGWLVARLDRRNHKAMVLAYAGFFAAIYSVDIAHDLLRGRGHPPILLLIVIIPITILAGGGVFSTPKKDGGSARDRAAAG